MPSTVIEPPPVTWSDRWRPGDAVDPIRIANLGASPPAVRADLAQAALLLLAPAGTCTRTVVMGENARLLAAAAGYMAGEGLALAGGPPALARLADASCDAIVLNRALERRAALDDPGEVDALLKECLRVLRPGGRILLTAENPYSIENIARALRSGFSSLGRQVRRHRLLLQALRRCCRISDVYLLWPRAATWTVLRPERSGLPAFIDVSLRGRLHKLIIATARVFGRESALAPGYLFIARRRGDARETADLAGSLQEAAGLRAAPVVIAARANSRSATFAQGGLFFKVPLSPRGAEALQAEVGNLLQVATAPIARFAPLPAQLRRHAGVGFATFAQLPPCGRSPCESDMVAFTKALQGEAAPMPLGQTDFWRRVFADDVRSMLQQLGATPLLEHLEQHCRERMVLAGPIHGDLHSGNVMADGCRSHLVDWDRYERCSPVLLDYAEAFLSCVGYLYGAHRRLPLSVLLEASGRRDSVLATQLTRSQGELAPAEGLAVYMLHRASWLLRRHGLSQGPELETARDQIAFCCLQLSALARPRASGAPAQAR